MRRVQRSQQRTGAPESIGLEGSARAPSPRRQRDPVLDPARDSGPPHPPSQARSANHRGRERADAAEPRSLEWPHEEGDRTGLETEETGRQDRLKASPGKPKLPFVHILKLMNKI